MACIMFYNTTESNTLAMFSVALTKKHWYVHVFRALHGPPEEYHVAGVQQCPT